MQLKQVIADNETWLVRRVLAYAKRQGYTEYTSTLEEAWRLSITGLSASILSALETFDSAPELIPDEDLTQDPLTQFGIEEARLHRERGISLAMFQGLMKYYRQGYVDLVEEKQSTDRKETDKLFIERCFDRIEVALCQEWAEVTHDAALKELQDMNRLMTNEKNAYLTVFESLSDPVLMLDSENRLLNLNHAAAKLAREKAVPGDNYYVVRKSPGNADACDFTPPPVLEVFPWIKTALDALIDKASTVTECEYRQHDGEQPRTYQLKRSSMLDFSEKFAATIVILRDITELRHTVTQLEDALAHVKRLAGLLPICSSCKKVRDDEGYWQEVENYVSDHSEAAFSHGFCPECLRKLYPDYAEQVLAQYGAARDNHSGPPSSPPCQ